MLLARFCKSGVKITMAANAEAPCPGQKFRQLGLPPCSSGCGSQDVCLYAPNDSALPSTSPFVRRILNKDYVKLPPTQVVEENKTLVPMGKRRSVVVFISGLLGKGR